MKIYTKTGDNGQTALIGGKRVVKSHPRIEAYGAVDELMAHVALLMDMLTEARDKDFLLWILDRLMTAASVLAAEGAIKKIPQLTTADVARIENRIDEIEDELEPLGALIVPGGNMAASQCHVARTVCRRAERNIVCLIEAGYVVPQEVIEFFNRLSDYFFVLSRKISKDNNILQKKWVPVVV